MKIYILLNAFKGDGRGLPEAAFKTKKAMMAYIRKEFPDARGTNRMEKNELYWEDETMWYNAETIELHE
jgi:hypothetical protein